ncbi:MAG: hypothetical protein PHO46_10275 [Thermoguttaceae bacterium]|nr:hypothetical protein [Thermoguttaceae bacterium]
MKRLGLIASVIMARRSRRGFYNALFRPSLPSDGRPPLCPPLSRQWGSENNTTPNIDESS